MMESNDSFFFAVNAATASASAAANYFPWRRPQLLGSPDLDAPHNRSARRKRKRKSSHGVRRRSSVKDDEENNDNDDDEEEEDEEENQNPFLLPPNNKLTEEDSNPKRCRADRSEGTATINPNPKTAENGANKDSNEKESSSKQDYIHVRARRGQATDSHSLAERVRREKISERMKLLQNLVPGCNKVMGKALMLDEIINYVQSLQRQVELLSMKLAAVNPLDFCVNGLLRPKDMNSRAQQQQQAPDLPAQIYRSENSSAGSSYSRRINGTPLEGFENKFVLDELDPSFRGSSISMEYPTLNNGFADASQLGNFWEDDLQSVVQMGFFGQSRDAQANNLLSELLRPCGD